MLNGLKLFLKTVLDENKGTFILLTIHFFPEYFVKKFNFFFGNIIKKTILSENSLIKFKFLKNLDLTPFMIAFYRSFKLQFIKNIKIYENISIRTFSFSQNTNFFHQLIQILALIILILNNFHKIPLQENLIIVYTFALTPLKIAVYCAFKLEFVKIPKKEEQFYLVFIKYITKH